MLIPAAETKFPCWADAAPTQGGCAEGAYMIDPDKEREDFISIRQLVRADRAGDREN